MNRRPHSAIGKTPFEAWWDFKPDLSALKVFGSRVCVKVMGKRKSKLNRHDFTGIFIGYSATDDNIRYIDVHSGVVKTSHHAVFDKAWYLQPRRPPAAQLLYDMGMEQDETPMTIPPPTPPPAPYPIIPKSPLQKPPHKAILYPLPFRITPTPMDCPYAASAAKLERTQEDIAVEFLTIGGEDCKSTFQQIYL